MPLPTVAIVGRPNVGKSSLLNMRAGRRIAIVVPTAGVTRDRISALCVHRDCYFDVVDTGGYGIVDRDDLSEQVEQQIRYAVEQAAMILFVVDARDGLTALDQDVARWLRGCGKPVILLANKVDAAETAVEIGDFFSLGFGEPMAISALHGRGREELKDRIAAGLQSSGPTKRPAEAVMKLAIVGRRNVGKSSFINALAGQERVIVSEIAGTTRDAVDVRFERDGRVFIAIDTAGVRRKGKIADDIEYYGFHRAELSIRRADVVLFMLDATASVGQVDKHLGGYIAGQYKPCVLVVNKWDLAVGRASTEAYGEYLNKTLPGLAWAPIAFTTASQGRNVQSVVDLASSLFRQAGERPATARLNEILERISQGPVPRGKRGTRPLKLYYGTQIGTHPPTIALFVNDPSRVTPGYERFLLGRLREALPFAEVPIRLVFRGKGSAPAPRRTAGRRSGR